MLVHAYFLRFDLTTTWCQYPNNRVFQFDCKAEPEAEDGRAYPRAHPLLFSQKEFLTWSSCPTQFPTICVMKRGQSVACGAAYTPLSWRSSSDDLADQCRLSEIIGDGVPVLTCQRWRCYDASKSLSDAFQCKNFARATWNAPSIL